MIKSSFCTKRNDSVHPIQMNIEIHLFQVF